MADPTRVVRAIAGLFKPADEAAAAVKQAEPLTKSERLAKLAETERALPLRLARAPAKSKQEIASHAERVGRQMLGEHVRKPGKTVNLADRSLKESKRVQGLRYELEPTKVLPESVPYEPRIGDVNVAFPGDYTVSDVILKSVDDVPIGSVQEGGSRYGLGKLDMDDPLFWASNEGPAQLAQDKITDVAHLFEPERVLAHHLAMGPTATNFAQHFADANLRAIDYSKLSRKDMDLFNRIIAGGYDVKNKNTGKIESVTFPHWPGIEDPEAAYAAMKADPELRKWFNNRMKTPKVTEATNMPNGLDIQWAITHPELRNMEINLTGHSVGEMIPGAQLTGTAQHQTYSKGIRGKYLGHQQQLTPFAISFPDAAQHIASTKRPAEFTGTIQKIFPHQIVDQQYLDELGEYDRQLRKMILGKKKGGSVKDPQKQLDEMMAPLFAKGGKVEKNPQQELDEMLAPLMGKKEEAKPLQWKADGGAMKVREPAIKRMKWKDTAPMKMASGGVASEHTMPDPTDSGATRFEPGYAGGGFLRKAAKEAIGKAAESAGMKAPVTAEKELTTLQDFHTSLGDRIRMEAEIARKMMEGFDYKYDKGQRVFTKDSAAKNRPPYEILGRDRVGNQVVYDTSGGGMRQVKDPETGRAKRTPYEPGYRVRYSIGPDEWVETTIPASAIIGDVGMKDGGAAFGVFPQMKGKRSKQDPEAAKNVPIDVARGIVSGVLGAPGDIESLVRMLPGLSEKTVLPTSEDIEKRLPLRSDTPVSQAAAGLGQLAGGFYTGPGSPLRLIGGLPSAVKRAGKEFVEAAGQTVSPLTVYHGSPHKFAPTPKNPLGEFNPKKIGSGEGAQAYGHGHYTAQAPEVAEEYARNLANRDLANQGRLNAHANAQRLASLSGDPKYAADDIRFVLSNEPDHPQKTLLQDTLAFLESGDFAKPLATKGNIYTIDLSDEVIPKMLDWDAKFEKQHPDVQSAILKYWSDNPGLRHYGDPKKMTGEGIYGSVRAASLGPESGAKVNLNPANEAAAMDLRYYGIPGIKYLDEASRSAGEGTRNFVVFPGEEEALTILERKKKGGPIDKSRQAKLMSEIMAKMNGRKRTQEVTYGY